jgi:gamma-glutamyltranspeptidase / glutathione hydrolase
METTARQRPRGLARRRVVRTVAIMAILASACASPAPEEPPGPRPQPVPESGPDGGPDDEEEFGDPGNGDQDGTEDEPVPPPESAPALGAYGVSAGDPAAVAAGMQVLAAGGNAVDAAIATAFAISVVEPFASGIGGGGAALVVPAGGEALAYDYREVVPADGRIPANDTGVPGFVAGMAELHADHGTLDLPGLLEPAITLARGGTDTSPTVAAQLRSAAYRLPVDDLPHLYPEGRPLGAGERMVQDELADTLEELATTGLDAFYEGAPAERLATAVAGVDRASLAGYDVQRATPPSGRFAGLEVVGAAPPLPGVALIQLLQVAEALGIAETPPGTAEHVHRLALAWRTAEQTVATQLGDPDFVDVPASALTDPERNRDLAEGLDDERALALATAGGGSSGNTTHLTVVGADGSMVSMTNTLTNFWGSGQYLDGFFLNDQLSRFAIGVGGSNNPEAGRRSVSWSLPVIVLDEAGRPLLGLGSPGGRRIPTILGQVLVRWALHGQTLQEAVEAPRFHLEGRELQFEALPPEDVLAELGRLGYTSRSVPELPYYFGSVQALEIDHDEGGVRGTRDERRDAAFDVGSG